jgi:hypothetical protein
MAKIKQFCRYWWESVTSSKEAFDMITWILTEVAWLTVAVIELVGFSPPSNWQVLTGPYFEKAAWIVAIILALRAVFWLPFRRHQKQESDFYSEMKILNRECQQLKNQLSERNTKQTVSELIKYHLRNLEDRILAIKKMTGIGYKNILKDGLDEETELLLDKISACLDKDIAPGTSILFLSRTGIKYKQIPGQGYFGYEEDVKKQAVVDQLEHFASQLKEIINNYK